MYQDIADGRDIINTDDCFLPYDNILTVKGFEKFVEAPDGDLIENVISVLTNIRDTRAGCNSELIKALDRIKKLITDIDNENLE